MRRLIAGALLLAASGTPALAATRGFSVTSFERIRVAGPYKVTITVGPGSSGRAEGPQDALDRLRIENQGTVLLVTQTAADDGGMPRGRQGASAPVSIVLTTPALAGAAILGSANVAIDRPRGARFDLTLSGSAQAAVTRLDVDRLSVMLAGSGSVTMAGHAAQARIVTRGAGSVELAQVAIQDAELAANGSGDVRLAASRTAKGVAAGSGDVTVAGAAACTIRQQGTGNVTCGSTH